jgi:hypothetical protein
LVAAGDTEVVELVGGAAIAESTVEFPVADGATDTVPLELTVGVTEPTVVVVELDEVEDVLELLVVLLGITYLIAYA